MPVRRVSILIADEHPEMVSALVSVLEDDPRLEVVGTVATGDEAVAFAQDKAVDLVLLDVHMPTGGVEAAEALTALRPPPVVVAISAQSGPAVVEAMVRAGATGYVTKGRVGETLPDLLIRCADGEVVLASPVAGAAMRAVIDPTIAVV
jgi:DNA-binding NarL/FixJ family response regulator